MGLLDGWFGKSEEPGEEENKMDERTYEVIFYITDGDGLVFNGLTLKEAKEKVKVVKEALESNKGYVEFEEAFEGEYKSDLILLNKLAQINVRVE